ncbi:MAG: ABC transporter permease [Chloroflexota bacterium]|nr:ABC transporter permease [Chloroflexota bacterium]
MLRYLVRRVLLSLLVVIAVSMIVFVLSQAQGDPRFLFLSETTTQEQWDAWGRQMGLDRPVVVQYFIWMSKVARGDLGQSLRQSRPVKDAITETIPASLQLGLAAGLFAITTGFSLGVLSAVKRGTIWDYMGRTFALFGQALPPFWVGIVLILVFSVQLHMLPTSRRGGIEHYIMPSITLGWLAAAANLRLVRSSMLATLDSEYIKMARAKGVPEWLVIWKHALRNAIIPPLTQAGLMLASFIAGTVVTETVFAWPGLGRLAVEAVYQNDFPLLSGVVLFVTLIYIVANLLVDVSYAYIDPRIRYG